MSISRRRFLSVSAWSGVGTVLASTGWPGLVRAPAAKSNTVSHRVSTFVYGQHLVAKDAVSDLSSSSRAAR